MLTIWGRADSSNVQAVMWGIAEMGLEAERLDAGHRHGVVETEAFAAMNPNRTIPVLVDGDNPPLWESGAILRYLANRYSGDPFWPVDPVRRADVDRWAEWAKLNVAMGFTQSIFWRLVRTPAAERDHGAIAAAAKSLGRYMKIAEERLARHPFLAGEALTLADIPFGQTLHRYYDVDIDRPDLPALAAYHARLMERPAYRTHVCVSYEALRA